MSEPSVKASKVVTLTGKRVWKGLDAFRGFLVPIEELNIDEANARKHPDDNLAATQGSLQRLGQHRLAVAVRRGRKIVVRIGNGMLVCARSLGWTHLAAVVVSESEVDSTARALADNRTAELAAWDPDALSEGITLVDDDDLLSSLGFDDLFLGDLGLGDGLGDVEVGGENPYSLKVDSPLYEPSGDPPPEAGELYDERKDPSGLR